MTVSTVSGLAAFLSTEASMLQDLCWHHRMCTFAHHPHPNVLPAMPTCKKKGQLTGMIVQNGDVGVGPTL